MKRKKDRSASLATDLRIPQNTPQRNVTSSIYVGRARKESKNKRSKKKNKSKKKIPSYNPLLCPYIEKGNISDPRAAFRADEQGRRVRRRRGLKDAQIELKKNQKRLQGAGTCMSWECGLDSPHALDSRNMCVTTPAQPVRITLEKRTKKRKDRYICMWVESQSERDKKKGIQQIFFYRTCTIKAP